MTASPAVHICSRFVLAVAGAAFMLDLGCAGALAQGRLDARYVATLAGVPIGKGVWVIDIADDQYTAAASGGTSGLLKVFSSGHGSGAARGAINAGRFVPMTYASTTNSDRKSEELRLTLNSGTVKEISIEPPSPPNPDRVPVTDAHRRGIADPMTASLVKIGGSGDLVSAEACNRKIAVFDGRMRFDVQLSFKRMENVKAEKGYQGPAAVCAAYFVPLAGHVPDRTTIKYLVSQRDMEVWLAPIAGTRVLVPYRFTVPTPLGLGVLQATQFVSVPQAGKLSPATARTQ